MSQRKKAGDGNQPAEDRTRETVTETTREIRGYEWGPENVGTEDEAPWEDGPAPDYETLAREAASGTAGTVLPLPLRGTAEPSPCSAAARPEGGSLVTLDELAGQMRFYADGSRNDYLHMCMNLLQCGRVMTEAKGRIAHGEWESWVEENSGFSFRNAEHYMQAYQEFGLNPDIARLGKTKMIRLLPVPEDIRAKVMEEHDLEKLSTRELEQVIREEKEKAAAEARAKAWAEAGERMAENREKAEKEAKAAEVNAAVERNRAFMEGRDQGKEAARKEAEARIAEAEERAQAAEEARNSAFADGRKQGRMEAEQEAAERPAEIPEEMKAEMAEKDRVIAEQKDEINRIAAQARETMDALNGSRELIARNSELEARIGRLTEKLENSGRKYAELKDEYLNLQSTIQKGDAERTPADELTAETLAQAVRSFIGSVARMPHMAAKFAAMDPAERQNYDTLLRTVEEWAKNARKALDTAQAGGVVL